MNELLHDLVAHNAWATRTLLTTCSELDAGQLAARIPGSFGDIRETFEHFIIAERWYLYHLTRDMPDPNRPDSDLSMAEIRERLDELDPIWQQMLAEPIDCDRWIRADGDEDNTFEFTAGVVIAQIFNHANEHREQICAILTEIGIQPPEIDGWNYSAAAGRGRLVNQA